MKNPVLKSLLFLIIIPFLASCLQKPAAYPLHQQLSTNWQLELTDTLIDAKVPGCVHTDLIQAEIIDDPFYRGNEDSLQWVSRLNPVYQCTFRVHPDILKQEQQSLKFHGIDTYAKAFLNGHELTKNLNDSCLNNMFRIWEFDVKQLLDPGENTLSIHFFDAEKSDSIKAASHFVQYPDQRAFSRKAPYQYNWDWGPKFVTSGIWKPVELIGWSEIQIVGKNFITKKITGHSAETEMILEIESTKNQDATIKLEIINPSNKEILQKTIQEPLDSGFNSIKIPLNIADPELWWCNGQGKAKLYTIKAAIHSHSNSDMLEFRTGIRTLELQQIPDDEGKNFRFVLNGRPVFIKGANYIPQDNFTNRTSEDQYKKLILQAKNTNMNMLRVWGGGIYENEIFYNLCDENGLLVWQDFMFACNLYPGDSAFLENVRYEARDNIRRIRHHPSLALWCGNNEIKEGWYNWGWQKSLGYSVEDSTRVWEDYQDIFHKVLPEEISKWGAGTGYHPSSPANGWGREISLHEGDLHYWGVWWGAQPFEMYIEKTGRFMSEYGFQAYPDMQTIQDFSLPEDRYRNSPGMQTHQKHPRGEELIETYMQRDFQIPKDFDDFIYASQMLQAYGIGMAIEAHRKEMARCGGTLYWQLNDCWPVISWSSLDYYGRQKALHHQVRRLFKNTIIPMEWINDTLRVYAVSDTARDFDAQIRITLFDQNNENHQLADKKMRVQKGSNLICEIPKSEIGDFEENASIVYAALQNAGQSIAENHFFLQKPKKLKLQNPKPKFGIINNETGNFLTVESPETIYGLHIYCDSLYLDLSDNYFDMYPGEKKTLKINNENTITEDMILFNSINQINLQK